MNQAPSTQRPGLRERKKARTRAAIREHALRLFREQGYDATTIDQIAEAADVSPSTFFRYFPTKEDVVLQDDMDVLAIGAFEDQTADLTLTVPELRARAMDEFSRTIGVIAEAAARRAGRDPDDFAVRVLAGAIVGVIMAATMPWEDWAKQDPGTDMLSRIDAALGQLEAGLPL